MTQEEVMEQVIKKIAQKFLEYDFDRHGIKYGTVAKEILSIPEILIKDPDQSHEPPYFCFDLHPDGCPLLKENWVKVLPK